MCIRDRYYDISVHLFDKTAEVSCRSVAEFYDGQFTKSQIVEGLTNHLETIPNLKVIGGLAPQEYVSDGTIIRFEQYEFGVQHVWEGHSALTGVFMTGTDSSTPEYQFYVSIQAER